jgi:hypothetical protein
MGGGLYSHLGAVTPSRLGPSFDDHDARANGRLVTNHLVLELEAIRSDTEAATARQCQTGQEPRQRGCAALVAKGRNGSGSCDYQQKKHRPCGSGEGRKRRKRSQPGARRQHPQWTKGAGVR